MGPLLPHFYIEIGQAESSNNFLTRPRNTDDRGVTTPSGVKAGNGEWRTPITNVDSAAIYREITYQLGGEKFKTTIETWQKALSKQFKLETWQLVFKHIWKSFVEGKVANNNLEIYIPSDK